MDGCTEIPEGVFKEQTALASVQLPATLKTIGAEAFRECLALSTVTLNDGLEEIGSSAFYGVESLLGIVLPSSLKSRASSAFRDSGIQAISLPQSIKTISGYTFSGCSNLVNIMLQEGLEEIQEYAFSCPTKELVIPSTVKRVECEIFSYIGRIGKATVRMLPVDPPTAYITTSWQHIFNEDTIEKIIVPKGSGDAYKNKNNWDYFAGIIEEEP